MVHPLIRSQGNIVKFIKITYVILFNRKIISQRKITFENLDFVIFGEEIKINKTQFPKLSGHK